VPIANGERLNTIWEFRELLEAGGAQFVRPDVGLAGGLSQCRKIAAIAEAHHAVVCTHNFLGPVITAASAHLDTSIPNFVVQEYSEWADEGPFAAAFPGALKRVGGYLPVPEAPGLGVTLEEEKLTNLMEGYGWDMVNSPLRHDGSVALAI
jgi:galactonate dehydratase